MAKNRISKSAALSMKTKKATNAQLEAAFTALRDAFRKQVFRLVEGTETQQAFAAPYLTEAGDFNFQTLKSLKDEMKNLPPDASRRTLEYSVRNLQTLIESPRMSLKGWQDIEKRTVQTLRSHKYKNINKKNLAQFGAYMEGMRDLYSSKFFPSAEVAEAYNKLAGQAAGEISEMQLGQMMMDLRLGGATNGVDIFKW